MCTNDRTLQKRFVWRVGFEAQIIIQQSVDFSSQLGLAGTGGIQEHSAILRGQIERSLRKRFAPA